METEIQKKVLDRVRKMLALANDAAAAEGERDNALRMAHATLAKHNFTMAEAEKSGSPAQEARVMEFNTSRDQPWSRRVSNAVAELFFCKYFFDRPRHRKAGQIYHWFVGRESNVTTAKLMADYVIKSIMSEANSKWKQQPDPGPWWTSFCKGAAAAVDQRCYKLREMRDEQTAAVSSSTALVLTSVYKKEMEANLEFTKAKGLELTPTKTRQKEITEGYREGLAFGATISLNNQIGAAPSSKALA